MDDTAFFYSRTLRWLVAAAIIIPLVVIGLLLWHFLSDLPPSEPTQPAGEAVEAVTADEQGEDQIVSAGDENPLKPLGPPASGQGTSP
jgi:hypothetical protein